ncbi:hypothetical protein DL763_008436 [Monosporascus cannonballus]|nr:hypothetical protein DL763_008436 [Monosporascus cannonballus]
MRPDKLNGKSSSAVSWRVQKFTEIANADSLVTDSSACLDGFPRQGLPDVTHSGMNKFDGPENPGFKLVKDTIRRFLNSAPAVLERRKPNIQHRHFLVPFGRNENFVGRDSILEQLLERIPPSANRDDCQRTAIEGLGGVGKTQVALEAAYCVRDQHPGKYEEAKKLHWQALQIIKKKLGGNHPDTLTSMNNLALTLQSRGKYEEAEQMHRQTFQLREEVLGRKHPDTLGSMNNLLREEVLGRKHPDTLDSMNNLACVLRSQGKHDEAEQMHRQALELREAVLGSGHPDTLALVLGSQWKHEEAEQMHEDSPTEELLRPPLQNLRNGLRSFVVPRRESPLSRRGKSVLGGNV